jgi:hypothetical protein
MHNNELRYDIARPSIKMRRQHLPHLPTRKQPRSHVDFHTTDHATMNHEQW